MSSSTGRKSEGDPTPPAKRQKLISTDNMFEQLKEQMRAELRDEIESAASQNKQKETLAIALSYKTGWERQVASTWRISVRLDADGLDEIHKYKISSAEVRFRICAVSEIIRRADPTDVVIQKCYAPKQRHKLAMQVPLDELNDAMILLHKQKLSSSPPDLEITYRICRKACLRMRNKLVPSILSHPFYMVSKDQIKKAVRQKYIDFFDELFTCQMMGFTCKRSYDIKTDIMPMGVLRLGADHIFDDCSGLETGGKDTASLKEANMERLLILATI